MNVDFVMIVNMNLILVVVSVAAYHHRTFLHYSIRYHVVLRYIYDGVMLCYLDLYIDYHFE